MAKRRSPNPGFHTPFAKLELPSAATPKSASERAPARRPKQHQEAVDTRQLGSEGKERHRELDLHARTPLSQNDRVDDTTLFLSSISDTAPLSDRHRRVVKRGRRLRAAPDDEQEALQQLHDIVNGRGSFRVFESEEDHSGIAPGVSFQLLDDLKRGRFAYRRHLDLHGLSRDAARAALQGFVIGARRDDERCVLVVTGRGRKSPGGLSVLREALPRWLSRAPLRAHVLAYCTARGEDGGPGAFYVLLRRAGVRPFGATL